MAKRPLFRIDPYPTKGEVKQRTRDLIAFIIFVCGVLITTILSKEFCGWVFLVIFLGGYILLQNAIGYSYLDLINAYKKQNDFHKSSLITNARVLDRKQSHGFWLTISFEADTLSNRAQEQQLIVPISQAIYQQAGETIAVRYSTLNPRIAAVDGEEGFYRSHPPIRH